MPAIIRFKRKREEDVAESFANVAKRLKCDPAVDVSGLRECIKFAGTVAVQEECLNLVTQVISSQDPSVVDTTSNDQASSSTPSQYQLIDVESSTNDGSTVGDFVYDAFYIDSERYWGVEFSLYSDVKFYEEPHGYDEEEEEEARRAEDEDLDGEDNFHTQYPEDDYEIGSAGYPSRFLNCPRQVLDDDGDNTDSDREQTDSDGDDDDDEKKDPVKHGRYSKLESILSRLRRDL